MNMPVSIDFAALQKELGGDVGLKLAGRGKTSDGEMTPEKMFSHLLDQALGGCKKAFMYKVDPKLAKSTQGGDKNPKETNGDQPWAETFRKLLMTGGIPLEDLRLSGDAMAGLKKLLLDQGVSKIKVERFLEGLFDGRADGIKVLALLKKLGGLKEVSLEECSQVILEASVIPHMETVLRKFGLDAQETGKILNESRTGGGELDLEILSRRLKAYLDMNPEKLSAEIKQETLGDDNGLLRRIGVAGGGERANGPISLETFVQMLKDRVAQLKPHALSDTQMDKEVKGLLNHVFVKEQGEHTKEGGLAERRNTPELQSFFQKKGPDAVTEPKSTNPDRNAENSRLAAWKFAQASKGSSESKTVSGDNNRFEMADLFKQMSDAKPERWMEIREKFIPKNQGEDKSPDTTHLRGGLFTRTLNSAQTARPATESIPVHVVNQVGRRISLALKNGQNHVKIQLKPPDLGSIQLEMSMKDNVLKVAMIAEHHSVKDMLMSHVSDLKQSLLQQGIELQKVDVEIDYDFGQSMANAQKNLTGGRSGKGRSASNNQSADLEEGTESLEPLRTRARDGHTVLDLFA